MKDNLVQECVKGQHLSFHCKIGTIARGAFSKFWGCQGRRTGVVVTTVSNSLILGGWVTNVLKNGDEKIGGGRVGDHNISTFLCYWLDKKCHFKKFHFGRFFLFVFVNFRNS